MFIVDAKSQLKKVKLLSVDGSFIGIVSRDDALQQSRNNKLDLICINPNIDPPLCRIGDMGKIQYDRKKNKQKSTKVVVKEVKLRPNTDIHDMSTKAKHVEKFLGKGYRVKISMLMFGREMNNISVAREKYQEFMNMISGFAYDSVTVSKGNSITSVIKPE